MRTRLCADNPFGFNRKGFAWEKVLAGTEAHLDVGCFHGRFLASLKSKGVERLVGADVSRSAIELARQRYPDLDFYHIPEGRPLPFEDEVFTSASLLDVLEHVYDQESLLGEIHRVLRPEGQLIVTVPQRCVFSFLDSGNLKFRFPRLHRWFYQRRHSPEQYRQRYEAHPDGLIGDISARKRWHEHFSRADLERLLVGSGFQPVSFDGSALFERLLMPFRIMVKPFPLLRRLGGAIAQLDARCFESSNLFCVARKRPVSRSENLPSEPALDPPRQSR